MVTLLSLACWDGSSPNDDGTVRFVGLHGVPESGKFYVGQTLFLRAATYDHAHNLITGIPITWSTSDSAIASIQQWSDGVAVTGVAPGSVAVTATSQGERAIARLDVLIVPVAAVRVTPAAAAAYAGMVTQLEAVALDSVGGSLANRQVTWTSSDPSRATVDGTGKVTVRAGGTVTITATCEGKSGSAEVTLLARPTADWSAVTQDWVTYQGNAEHTGFVPATLDPVVFAVSWERVIAPGAALNAPAAAEGRVFVSTSSYFGTQRIHAVDAVSGAERWSYNFGPIHSVDPPAYANGSVYLTTGGHQDSFVWRFDAATGAIQFKSPYENQWSRWHAPVVIGPTLYMAGGYYGGMYAFDAGDGTRRWFAELTQYDWFTPAVGNGLVYAFLNPGPTMRAVNAVTGAVEYDIPIQELVGLDLDRTPVLGGSSNLLTAQGGRLISFDLANRRVGWILTGSFTGQPVLGEGVIYTFNGGDLEARRESDGSLLWSYALPETFVMRKLLATRNLVFVSDGTRTFAVDIGARLQAWSYPAGGHLALTRDGLLLIARADGTLTALDVK
jgi:outer membrane protein assembly factor BamB